MADNNQPGQSATTQIALPHLLGNRAVTRSCKPLAKNHECQPHLVLIVTAAMSTRAFHGQIRRLREAGFRVSFISNPGPQTQEAFVEGAEVIALPMEREIALFRDLISLWRLWSTLRRIRPDITNVGTPKAGLLGGIAARLAFIPRRVYTLHGLRLETAKGWKRGLLKLMECISCHNAQYVRCVSLSVRERAIQLGVLHRKKAYVIGAGSANGIDCDYYLPTPERILRAMELRSSLGIPASALVIGFVGRFTRDKGFTELYGAYIRLKQSLPELHLLLVGDFEDGDPVDPAIRERLQSDANVHFTGIVPDAATYYHAMQVLAFPTYREGLSVVCLEAQASGIPVVTTTATGARDSVLDGITAKLVPPRDEAELAAALQELLTHPEKRQRMGNAGATWVKQQFRRELISDAVVEDYRRILREEPGHSLSLPRAINQI
jgi:glycosyltransferase involved in cell wall biosynthesis